MMSLPKHLYRTVDQIWATRLEYFGRLLLLILLGICNQLAFAQQLTPRVYTYVEQMPELPGGGGTGAIVNEFFKRLTFPAKVYDEYYGHPMVYFEVGPTGNVQHTRIAVTSHSATLDKAILAAVNSFPKFTPGYQDGRPVTVSFTLPIACLLPNR